ncbi:hypothetical protein HK096_002269, partial [Nowakowskiella sp. JEL0078]
MGDKRTAEKKQQQLKHLYHQDSLGELVVSPKQSQVQSQTQVMSQYQINLSKDSLRIHRPSSAQDIHRPPSAQHQLDRYDDHVSRFYSQQQPNNSNSSFYESDSFSHVTERDLDSRNTNRHSMSDTVSINSISAPLGVAEGRSLFFSAKEPKNEMLLLTSGYRPHFNEEKNGRLGTGPPPEFAKLPDEADYA